MVIQLVDLSDAELDAFLEEFLQQETTSSSKIESDRTPELNGTYRAEQYLCSEL